MANRIAKGESSPGVKRGGSIGPALNPTGLQQGRKKGLYLDPHVARDEYVSDWDRWSDDEKSQAHFSKPVRSRL